MTKEEQMRAAVANYFKLGAGNKLQYSQKAGLKVHAFKYWLRKIEGEAKLKAFLPVKPAPYAPIPIPKLEILYPNGVKFLVAADSQSEYLRQLILLY